MKCRRAPRKAASLLPILAVAVLVTSQRASAAISLQNGSFELASGLLPGNEFDFVTPAFWTYSGTNPYPRVGSGGFDYPLAPDGTTFLAVEGERDGELFQDLGTMTAGETYRFSGTVMRSIGINSYRVSFIGDPAGSATELAFITEADFAPEVSSSLNATFAYTATPADDGKVLRLQLTDNGATTWSRSAFDQLSVTLVPEPATSSLVISALALGLVRRRRP